MHYSTFLTYRHEAVDCHGDRRPFEKKVLVSCIQLVKPSAPQWLMHMAIAHSLTHMNMKSFEFMVWIAGNSPCVRRLVWVLLVISFIIFLGLFFGGVMLEFVSSWLSFVMSLSLPVFMFSVWKTSTLLEHLWRQQAKQAEDSIEQHFQQALAALPHVEQGETPAQSPSGKTGLLHMRFMAPPKLSQLFSRRGWGSRTEIICQAVKHQGAPAASGGDGCAAAGRSDKESTPVLPQEPTLDSAEKGGV